MSVQSKQRRVALVHDYLREYGGAERVLEVLHQLFPEAPVYVAFVDKKVLGLHWAKFKDWDLRQTWLAKIPLIKKIFSPLRLIADRAFMSLDLSEYDLIISSSNMYEAKAVKVPYGKHYCYCHTPPRALYGYNTMTNWQKKPVISFFGKLINHYLRIIDYKHAQRVDHFIANSAETADRIRKFYRRDSRVIFPPVEIPTETELENYRQQAAKHYPTNYYLYLGRLAFSKHPELAVQAAGRLGFNLKVVGEGKMLDRLQEQATNQIEFLGSVHDVELHWLLAGAQGLIFPVEDEDFGLVPVEAMAHGIPVLAHHSGGPLETVKAGVTGQFFTNLTVEGLVKAWREFDQQSFLPEVLIKHSQQFSQEEFLAKLEELLA